MKQYETAIFRSLLMPLALLILASGCATTSSSSHTAGDYAVPTVKESDAARAIAKIGKYNFGDSRVPLADVEDLVRLSLQSQESRAMLAAMLGDLLEGNATVDGKRFACRQLALIGTEAQVAQLAPLLNDPALTDLVRSALERIPGQEAATALAGA